MHVDYTLEEYGKAKQLCVEIEVECFCYPGELRTYDYPGSLPYVTVDGVKLKSIEGCGWVLGCRDDRPDWWDFAETCLEADLMGDPGFEETMGEIING